MLWETERKVAEIEVLALSTTDNLACGHRLEKDKKFSLWVSGERALQGGRTVVRVLRQVHPCHMWTIVRRQCC